MKRTHVAAIGFLVAAVLCEYWPGIGGTITGSANMTAETGRVVSVIFSIVAVHLLFMQPRKLG